MGNTRENVRHLTAAVVAAMALAACSDGGTTEEAQPGGEAAAEEETAFTVGFTTPGVPSVALLAAVDDLREQGYDIETPEVAEPELLVEGIINGEFQFSSETTTAALLGAQRGGDIQLISDLALNSWTLYGDEEVSSCQDLDGKRLAIHSQAGVSTALVRNYIEAECPDVEPEYLVIAGSPNRYAALLAGEIDASPLELSDAIALENEASDRFNRITNFAESLSEVHPTTVYGNTTFMEENPQLTTDLVAALLEQNQMISEDPQYLNDLITEYLGEVPNQEQVAERYAELFPPDGGLDEEAVQATIDFAVDAGVIEPGLTVEEAADLSYLEAAREAVQGG